MKWTNFEILPAPTPLAPPFISSFSGSWKHVQAAMPGSLLVGGVTMAPHFGVPFVHDQADIIQPDFGR